MKRIIIGSIVLVVVLFSGCGKQYDEKSVDLEVCIAWETVNLREDYSTNSDVIAELHQGENVFLTGHSYEYAGSEDLSTESWHQVRTSSGQTGWIVTDSIQW